MKIIRFPVNPFQMNCYIYYDEKSKEAILFDPGVYTEEEKNKLRDIISENELNVSKIINTHGHIDHILGNKFAKDLTGAPIYFYDLDSDFYNNSKLQGRMYGIDFPEPPPPDFNIDTGELISPGDLELRIMHTPGHSRGSLSFIDDKNKMIICGDLVFKESVGRTDLPGGDMNELLQSVQKLFDLVDDDYTLLPGHMETTTVGAERKYNPFLTSIK